MKNKLFPKKEFTDLYDNKCNIQQSSSAGEDSIYLGVEIPFDNNYCVTRMHLSKAMVEELLPLLNRFVKTGKIENQELIHEED